MNRQKLKRNIFLNYINTCIKNLNMQSSVWVLYLAYCGLNLMQIGLLEGIYHGVSILCEIPSGAMADLIGRKKSMVVSRICIAISCMLMLYCRSFWWFALSFAIQALGDNFNSGSEEALLYDSMKCLSREGEYMRTYGRLNMVIEVTQAVATVVGGILAEISYIWCYGASLVIAVLAVVPVLFMAEPPIRSIEEEEGEQSHEAQDGPVSGKAYETDGASVEGQVRERYKISVAGQACETDRICVARQVYKPDGASATGQICEANKADISDTRKRNTGRTNSVVRTVAKHFRTSADILRGDRRILRVITCYSVIFASYTLLFFYSQQYYYRFGFNKIQISVIMLFAGFTSCLGALHSQKLYQRFGERLVMTGALAMAAVYLLYSRTLPELSILAFLAASYFNSALEPVQSDTLNRLIPSRQRATLISVDSMFFSIVMILTFPIAGAAADVWGLGSVFAVLGGLLVIFQISVSFFRCIPTRDSL